jgi:hypothetical protein
MSDLNALAPLGEAAARRVPARLADVVESCVAPCESR